MRVIVAEYHVHDSSHDADHERADERDSNAKSFNQKACKHIGNDVAGAGDDGVHEEVPFHVLDLEEY